jgi:hypothetical protein
LNFIQKVEICQTVKYAKINHVSDVFEH